MTLKAQFPLGATLVKGGAQFAVRSLNATGVDLCLFDNGVEKRIALTKTGSNQFQIFVPGLKLGQQYGFRADGPWNEQAGHRFDVSKLLLDPFAHKISAHVSWHDDMAKRGFDTSVLMPKSILCEALPPLTPLPLKNAEFIYEVPVKAFTKLNLEIPESIRGNMAALAHPAAIAHFKRIGCDVVELMPVTAWSDERHLAKLGLHNAWGYNPAVFMALEPELAPGGLIELRDTVRVLHENGLRVFIDVVFNHTGESDLDGSSLSLRGLDNATYFRMINGVPENDTGCGNTLALERPAGIELVIAALRHWVLRCGIDGFRYDLAPVMGREATGFNPHAPLFEAIYKDDVLSQVVHIAEPWDVGLGGYQLGNFPDGWLEWNDRFRDDVRRFWRGDKGARRSLATRLAGSSDIFDVRERKPSASVNFIAAHDGFTLADLVRFSKKQNLANGENNRDGSDGEVCWVDDNPLETAKALLASLFCARGTVMLTAGDEFSRSQGGNNNAYAQDNETTWRDWKNADQVLIEFVAGLAKFRLLHKDYFADAFLAGKEFRGTTRRDVLWFGADGAELSGQDWQAEDAAVLGVTLGSPTKDQRLAIVFTRGNVKDVRLPNPQKNMTWVVQLQSEKFAAFLEANT